MIGPDGEAVRIATQVVVPFDGETVAFTHTFTGNSPVLPLRSESTLRFLGLQALADFLADAGLAVEEQFGDWGGGPLADASPEIITIARSP